MSKRLEEGNWAAQPLGLVSEPEAWWVGAGPPFGGGVVVGDAATCDDLIRLLLDVRNAMNGRGG